MDGMTRLTQLQTMTALLYIHSVCVINKISFKWFGKKVNLIWNWTETTKKIGLILLFLTFQRSILGA